MKQTLYSISAIATGAALMIGCATGDVDVNEELSGVESSMDVVPLASFSGSEGLRFATDELAREWTQEAAGVWRHMDSDKRLVIGEDGHRWSVAQLESELTAMRKDNADEEAIAAKEADLARYQFSLEKAQEKGEGDFSTDATCSIGLYTDGSGPLVGFVGSAAVAEISCVNGTVVFTVESLACTGTSGCGPVSVQTAIPDSLPRLWGTARSGFGSCFADVFVSLPAGIGQAANFNCN